jgi:uncharacterized protein YbjT (DUF2867 family)
MDTRSRKEKIILVTGATGRQGGAVAHSLLTGGWPVRALVRDMDKPAAKALKARGAELVKGDLEERSSLDRALTDVYGVFSVQSWAEHGIEGEILQGNNMADAARAAGVKHFIYSSVGGADQSSGVPHFESKWAIEEHIRAKGIPATIVRPVFFMFNFNAPGLHTSILDGAMAMPLRPDRPLQMLAVEDLGEFVRLAFESPKDYIGRAIELAGDEMTMPEAARIFSKLLGKPVRYVEQSISEVRRFNKAVAGIFEWFNEHGYRANIQALRALHPGLMTLETWLKKTKWVRAA